MYQINIIDINNNEINVCVAESHCELLIKAVTKKRFWRNKVVVFDCYRPLDNLEFRYSETMIFRVKNIIRFSYSRIPGGTILI